MGFVDVVPPVVLGGTSELPLPLWGAVIRTITVKVCPAAGEIVTVVPGDEFPVLGPVEAGAEPCTTTGTSLLEW